MDNYFHNLSDINKEDECPICLRAGFILTPMFQKGHKLYNDCYHVMQCDICNGKGYIIKGE